MYEQTNQSCGSAIKSCKIEQRKSTNGTNVYYKRKSGKCFESYWFFKDIHGKSFPALKQDIGKEDITFSLSLSSRVIEWLNENII